ncbi:hypothetical protein B7Z28_00555 [Candidatus Saccharibacteria bacterium 32-45-3]|nr:MAG: hypothetical protein B7Z28_00555 [Candidatus Saccharibacteria bacterium 32-45-3]
MKTKLVIFGITGDLSRRKLLPALRRIVASGEGGALEIIGVSRRSLDVDELVGPLLSKITSVVAMDLADLDDYQDLKKRILPKGDDQTLIYLSVPPGAATRIADNLGRAGINSPAVKLMFEKPFGLDYESAVDMVKRTSQYFDENQVYRIDHYLAKEMAQNIIAFRSGNAIFRHLWDGRGVERVEVRALEDIGIVGRGQFYEQTGALRDVVQGHMMQLLSLVLMDIPSRLNWDLVPDLRLQALRRIVMADPTKAVRAQYRGYREEAESPNSKVETFVKIELESDASNWEGVPLTVMTGKALDRKETEIVVYFKASHQDQSNALRFKIQPDEGIEIDLFTKKPGYERVLEQQKLQFKYQETELPEAYEQVIVDAIKSRKSLFTSSQEILESWRILQPLLTAWSLDKSEILLYDQGVGVEDIINSI